MRVAWDAWQVMLQAGSSAAAKVDAQLAASVPRLEVQMAATPLEGLPGTDVSDNIANNVIDFVVSAFERSPVPSGRNYTLVGLGMDGAALALQAALEGWPAVAAVASPLPGLSPPELDSAPGQAKDTEVLIVADLASSSAWEPWLADDGAEVQAQAVTDPAQ